MKRFIALLFTLMASCTMVPAQTLQVATGAPDGTYSRMLREVKHVCSSDIALNEVGSSGSVENVTNLVGNQVNAAFVQADVLWLRSRTEDLGNVKTLVSLHKEAVHVVTRAQSGLKTGGTLGTSIGAKDVVFTDVTSLAGYRVGAAGGSFVTAQVIRLQSDIAFTVQQFDKNDNALAALKAGTVQAVILVGGAPLGSVEKLGAEYRLLPFPAETVEKLSKVYHPTRLTYSKLNAAGVTSVATDALFVTREYRTERMIRGLAALRGCIQANIDDLKETTGTHPAWQAVDPANRGKWAYYELPATSSPITTAKKK